MFRHYVDRNQVTGRYAENKELERDYMEVTYENIDNPPVNKSAGIATEVKTNEKGEVIGAIVVHDDTNAILVASPGAGKTRRVLSQYEVSCAYARHNQVWHDPKGENLCYYRSLLEKLGYTIRVLNLRDPMSGDRFNLLQEPAALWKQGKRDLALEKAKQVARILFEPMEDKQDKSWTMSSVNLFLCYFCIAANIYEPEYVTLKTIYRIHIEGLSSKQGKSGTMLYLEQYKDEEFYGLGMSTLTAPNDTRNSVFYVFTNGLVNVILNDSVSDMLTDSTFSIEEFAKGDKPIALFLITRDEDPQTYSTLVASFMDMIYSKLIDLAQNEPGQRLKRTCHFIMEEFGNIARLENINNMMTASRSRGLKIILCLQSLSQMYLTYSKDLARNLIGNAQNLIYMSSTDMELIKLVSERCGTITEPYTNKSWDLQDTDQLTRLRRKDGETLMLLGDHYPHFVDLPDLSMYPMIKPVEKVILPIREKAEVEYGLFTKTIDDIHEKEMEKMMEKGRNEREKAMLEKRMTRQKMLDMPSEQKTILDEMIQDDRR